MTRGNKREIDRKRSQARSEKKGGGKDNKDNNYQQKKEKDAEIMRMKQQKAKEKKEEEEAVVLQTKPSDKVEKFIPPPPQQPFEGKLDNSIQMNELQERLHVLDLVQKLFNESLKGNEKEDIEEDQQIDLSAMEERHDVPLLALPDIEIGKQSSSSYDSPTQSLDRQLRKLAGVIPSGKHFAFERQLFRISRGKILIRMKEIEEPLLDQTTQKPIAKIAFCIYFIGNHLQKKIQKFCDASQATIYPICASQIIPSESMRLKLILHEKTEISRRTTNNIFSILKHISGNNEHVALAPLRQWQAALRREYKLCESLRFAGNDISFVHIEGWCMVSEVHKLRPAFEDVTQALGQHSVGVFIEHTDTAPPTFFKTSTLTRPFQLLVDTYGVPRYLEINPGLFTIIMYPFLFAVMYGDVFHGSVLLAIAIYLCLKENSLHRKKREGNLGEIFSMAFNGRYVLLLMGIFAVFNGFIYNDFASLPINLFQSGWIEGQYGNYTQCDRVYPFGVDSEWHGKLNTMHFYNSFKMKLSIIIGVTQMVIGICLKGLNDVFFKDWLAFFFEFLPQLLFMLCTFGYMTFLILYKMTIPSPSPNLIQVELNMFMSPGNITDDLYLYPGQLGIQTLCLLITVLCVPVMLVGKPLMILRSRRKKISPSGFNYDLIDEADNLDSSVAFTNMSDSAEDENEENENEESRLLSSSVPNTLQSSLIMKNSMYKISKTEESDIERKSTVGSIVTSSQDLEEIQRLQSRGAGDKNGTITELFIFQGIHTIEFVLGAVSNTASYLRLWALSLAHSELAEVFWKKVFMVGIESGNPIAIVIAFGAWAGATMFALVLMDILECILHALRLQWVEFQNKFFHADGYQFEPFSFYIKDDF